MKFCKIIEIEDRQVLFRLGMDDEQENEQLQMITQCENFEVKFVIEMKEDAELSFDDLEREATKEKAEWFLNMANKPFKKAGE